MRRPAALRKSNTLRRARVAVALRESRLRGEAAEVFCEPVSFRVRKQRVVGQGHATGVLNRPAYRVGRLRERRRGNDRGPPAPVTASERPSGVVDGLDEITNVGSVNANMPCFQPCYAASVQQRSAASLSARSTASPSALTTP